MLTRHSPLHAHGRAEVGGGGWWVKATAYLSRWIHGGRPGCPLTHQPGIASHCGGRSPIGRAPARRMSTKKVRGPILGTRHEDRRGRKTVVPDPKCPTGILLDRIVGRLAVPRYRTQTGSRHRYPLASGSASDSIASYHPTQSANQFQEKFLDSGDFSQVGLRLVDAS
jgi:hypothetical protein